MSLLMILVVFFIGVVLMIQADTIYDARDCHEIRTKYVRVRAWYHFYHSLISHKKCELIEFQTYHLHSSPTHICH